MTGVVLLLTIFGTTIYLLFNGASTTSQAKDLVTVIIPKGASEYRGPSFVPSKVTLVIGINNTIKWVDEDITSHSVSALSLPRGATKFDTIIIEPGQSYTLKLTVPGIYQYYCVWHPYTLRGTITVLGQSSK